MYGCALCVCVCVQSLPVIIGVAVVGATAILAKIFLFGNKKKSAPVTLKDSSIKYPLKLVDREVRISQVQVKLVERDVCHHIFVQGSW